MMRLPDPWILDGLGILLLAVGSAGLVALFITSSFGPAAKRAVGVACAVLAIGGGLFMAWAAVLRDADRTLDPAQQADLARAVSRFPDVRFEVFTVQADEETMALAEKLVEAIRAGTGAAPPLGVAPELSKKGVQKGVVLVLRDKDAELGRAVSATIGRALMAARVAAITDDAPELDGRTVRVVVGQKP
jgi:hypothetical protein